MIDNNLKKISELISDNKKVFVKNSKKKIYVHDN